ncbi:hypothetical protein KNO15_22210 [Leifsonia shinshuensis]|uniref:hypothetical protein n=1 Tax=Leifsonia shinshuensis TaxID=150026 RepID=UPI001F506678|nr:hypothetical protein [Leifsonia shinshuensis]MCI0159425.1 hypothetical protein [Leifsonia shinshuensis]
MNLTDRIAEASDRGRLDDVAGLTVGLDAVRPMLPQMRRTATNLGMPAVGIRR